MTFCFKRNLWVAMSVVLLGACGAAPAPVDIKAAEDAIREMDVQWSATAGKKDLEGLLAYYSDDADLQAPNAPMAVGKQAIREAWKPFVAPGANINWETKKVGVAQSGDLGFAMGNYQLSMKDDKGNSVIDKGKFMEIWKRQADGKWKCIEDAFNSDLPAAAPEPVGKKK